MSCGARHRALLSAVGAAMLVVGAPVSQAGAAPRPACGAVVTTNVKLTTDMTCPGGGLIVDGAGTVLIDLNGFTIRGTGTGTGIAIRNSTLVRVR